MLAGLATLAVLLGVIIAIGVTTLVCARPQPCRNCRRAQHRAGTR